MSKIKVTFASKTDVEGLVDLLKYHTNPPSIYFSVIRRRCLKKLEKAL